MVKLQSSWPCEKLIGYTKRLNSKSWFSPTILVTTTVSPVSKFVYIEYLWCECIIQFCSRITSHTELQNHTGLLTRVMLRKYIPYFQSLCLTLQWCYSEGLNAHLGIKRSNKRLIFLIKSSETLLRQHSHNTKSGKDETYYIKELLLLFYFTLKLFAIYIKKTTTD